MSPFAKNSGAAIRITMMPGAVTDPAGALSRRESVGESLVASTSMAGFAARFARFTSASTKATTMPAIEPMNRVTTKQTAATSELEPVELPQRAELADAEERQDRDADDRADGGGGDVGEQRGAEEEQQRASRLRGRARAAASAIPAWSMAAVRDVEDPTAKLPLAPGRHVPDAEGEQVAVGVGAVAVLLAVGA